MKRDTPHELRMARLYLEGREEDVVGWMKNPAFNHGGLPMKLESIREAQELIEKLIRGKWSEGK